MSEDSAVHTGKEEGSDDWGVEDVLIKKTVGEEQVTEIAEQIES